MSTSCSKLLELPAIAIPDAAFSGDRDASLGDACRDLTRRIHAALQVDDAQDMDFDALRGLLAALSEFYAADVNERGAITPLNTLDHASATSVLMIITGLLRGANLELFELGMWQTWSGLK